MKKDITVLWVDDRRNPLVYLKKKPEPGNKVLPANLDFYSKFMKKYHPKFVWVKSFDEFKEYIIKNGVPEFISFDRDLGNGPYNGEACASWLVDYCKENGFNIPNYYPHTANRKGKENIIGIMNGKVEKISHDDLKEAVKSVLNTLMEYGVYADKNNVNTDNKTIGITYNSNAGMNKGNALQNDNLKTDKMESNNGADTYNVKLKNGFECYNITDINGLQIMHYFKRKWDNQSTMVNYDGDTYKLEMKAREWNRFFDRFKKKVGFVVDYHLNRLERENKAEISAISIYPVPSSSNFNQRMAEELQKSSLNGMGVHVIPADILKKDLRNLEKDTDFIAKNKEFYSAKYSPIDDPKFSMPIEKKLDQNLARFKQLTEFQNEAVDKLNKIVKTIKNNYYQLSFRNKTSTEKSFVTNKHMALLYEKYVKLLFQAKNLSYSFDGKELKILFKKEKDNETTYYIIRPKVQKKGPSGSETLSSITHKIFEWVTGVMNACKKDKNLRSLFSDSDFDAINYLAKKAKVLDDYSLQEWEPVPFQIKNLSNGERMGVKGIYNPDNLTPEDEERIRKEVEKTKGTAVVVFDDNVSGGATLSDVCYQLSKLGMENIIPITFGQMSEKWTTGMGVPLTQPKHVYGDEKGFNY